MTDTTYHLTEADVQKTELKNPNAANLSTLKVKLGPELGNGRQELTCLL